jgi:hypothetical protein
MALSSEARRMTTKDDPLSVWREDIQDSYNRCKAAVLFGTVVYAIDEPPFLASAGVAAVTAGLCSMALYKDYALFQRAPNPKERKE